MDRIYYRIQPAGLPIAGHRSTASDESVPFGVDVFYQAQDVLRPDGPVAYYGDEVVVLRAGQHWENGDVEGVRIDPATAHEVARLSWSDFAVLCESTGLRSDEMDDAVEAHFAGVANA